MLFRPKFCANCGDKIERTEWRLWTSRRFCPVCESEFKGHDLLPRAVVVIGIVIGIYGIGSQIAGDRPKQEVAPPIKAALVSPVAKERAPVVNENSPPPPSPARELKPADPTASGPPIVGKPPVLAAAEEQKYFCGAMTKKGTPCSRKVKGGGRCFQHQGMPAMLSAEKLKAG